MAGYLNYKSRLYFAIFHPLMTFEYNCFGYKKAGNEVHKEFDGFEDCYWDGNEIKGGEAKWKTVRTAYFARPEEYPTNILFGLLEIIMQLVSFVRVLLSPLALGLALFFLFLGDESKTGATIFGYIFLAHAISFVIAIAGSIVRKIFKLDEQMDDLCDENGWKRWSEYSSRNF